MRNLNSPKYTLLSILTVLLFNISIAQNVGIGTTTPHSSAILDLTATNKGILIPRLTLAQRNAIATPATGLLVFQTDNTPGFYYFDGSAWNAVSNSASSMGWSTTGNSGTDPTVNFVGTIDQKSLIFKAGNKLAGKIAVEKVSGRDPNNTSWGLLALSNNTSGQSNTAIGFSALRENTTGENNTAVGRGALYDNISGTGNTAFGNFSLNQNTEGVGNTSIGNASLLQNTEGNDNSTLGGQSLYSNTTGDNNTASGDHALYSNTTGSGNTANGFYALSNNITGNYNTALGYLADVDAIDLVNATAVGARATVGSSNSIVLGSISGFNGAVNNTKVGIGTIMPAHYLHIFANSTIGGTVQLCLEENNASDYARLKFTNNGVSGYWDIAGLNNSTKANARLNFYLDGVGDILSLHGNGNAVLMGTLTQSSDARLKTNIQKLTNSLSHLTALNGYHYNWKNQNKDRSLQMGVLAQEVQQIFPELVKTNDKGMLSVNYIGLIPVMIEAIKEQQTKIKNNEQQITSQMKLIRELQKAVTELKND